LTPQDPLKTIALAIQRIGADSQNPHTIHLANGHYADEQHFPLNLRSYVSIVGESEEGVIFGGSNIFFMGWDSEKEVTIKNITFTATTDPEFYQRALIMHYQKKIDGFRISSASLWKTTVFGEFVCALYNSLKLAD
jgi:hypothetical protein